MQTHIALALIALNLACSLADPLNKASVGKAESKVVSVVAAKAKGDPSTLANYQDDQQLRACMNGECRLMLAGAAKALDVSSISAVFPLKGNAEMTKALTPSVSTVLESMKGLDEQKARLEKLQAEMASLNSMFQKGAQQAENSKGLFAATISKGVSLPAAPPMKAYAAALPPSKGAFAAPPSKGASASTMQFEAAMCPMTVYELGKSQKLQAETNAQLQSANTMNAMLMSAKSQLETAKNMAEIGKANAEQQAAFNAKYAAEQKARGDLLEAALAKANAEKAALEKDKADLEKSLSETQDALASERETTASLTEALKSCNEDKADLEADKAALIEELDTTKETLRLTQRTLEMEQNAHARTQRQLAATQRELEATEEARKQLEEAKQQLEDELAETKDQLEKMTSERDQLQEALDATSAKLAKCNEEKMQCNAELAQEKAQTAKLTMQLTDTMTLLNAEKKAREELTALLMSIKATAEALQAEVEKLQLENVQLKEQLLKLKREQEAALAMAAGCPPTYEKFGLSCYKYVREKSQWKMAQEQCMKDGGNLVSVESKQEQAFLVNYLKRMGARYDDSYAHLGAFDYSVSGIFQWLSNKNPISPDDIDWLSSNPRGSGRQCLAMQMRDMDNFGDWADQYCWNSLPFVCEIETLPV